MTATLKPVVEHRYIKMYGLCFQNGRSGGEGRREGGGEREEEEDEKDK